MLSSWVILLGILAVGLLLGMGATNETKLEGRPLF